jgi:ABC-type multidrug transport system ATPase subunit
MLEIAACDTDALVLILDEPTVGLDSHGIEKIMQRVHNLLQKGRGVIIITHDEDVARLAHRIVVIQNGVLVSETTP